VAPRHPDAPNLPARLTDPWYEASFFHNAKVDADGKDSFRAHTDVPLAIAQGLWMCCPCGEGHAIIVPFANAPGGLVPPDFGPMDRTRTYRFRWTMSGTGLVDLTISPSLDIGMAPPCWHSYIVNGEVRK
jgi:hypothetical protein